MGKTVIVYWSGTGNTEAMAMAVLEGAKEVNPDTKITNVAEISADEEFEPFFSALESKLSGKNVALFGSYGWGDGEWMRSWEERVASSGAKLIDSEGLIINETPDDDALEQCRELGKKAAAL